MPKHNDGVEAQSSAVLETLTNQGRADPLTLSCGHDCHRRKPHDSEPWVSGQRGRRRASTARSPKIQTTVTKHTSATMDQPITRNRLRKLSPPM